MTLTRITDNSTGAFQDTVNSYDGYSRLHSKHLPQQNAETSTVYSYNADDTLCSVTDARGASATYAYNNRHHVTSITYSAPTGITATPNAIFAYDAAGNRISMNDGLGSQSYTYDSLSRLTSETRTLNSVGNFTLSYDYNLAGELKKVTDATGMTINYGFDSNGGLTSVTGADSLYAGVSNYASNFQYRAFGGLKAMTDGTNHTTSALYNLRLQPTQFDISGNAVHQNYDYWNDGRMKFIHNTTDAKFDRALSYDHAGRIKLATTGGSARNDAGDTPYFETFDYDTFSNLTGRESQSWNGQTDDYDSAAYINYRRSGWGYDADGRNTTIDTRTYGFDVAGRMTTVSAQKVLANGNHVNFTTSSEYDGDGEKIKENFAGVITYYLRSSVLGGAIVEEINGSGQKTVGYVRNPSGAELARQSGNVVTWTHGTPASSGRYETYSNSSLIGRTELDPLGADISLAAPPQPPPSEGQGDVGAGHIGGIMDGRWSDFFNVSSGCTNAGVPASCSGRMIVSNFEGEMRASFGYQWYDMVGNDDEHARCEERYAGLYLYGNGGYGVDKETNRLQLALAVTYDTGKTQEVVNPTIEQFSAMEASRESYETSYGADSGSSDIGTHDVSTAYHVTTIAGAASLSIPQNTSTSKPNPNCIVNAIAGGRVGNTRNIMAGAHGGNAHDGIHVDAGPGIHTVTALPAMAGGVLHAGRQSRDINDAGYNFSVVDILLNTRIDGQRYVMTLKDMFYDTGIRSGRVIPGRTIGSIEGSDNPVGESGWHVTLMPYSTYRRYIDGRFTGASRSSVPVNQLMDAARDPRSPFRCP